MCNKYPHLCSPIKLGNVYFRNRMFAAPTGAAEINSDRTLGRTAAPFFEVKAKGGAANVTFSEIYIDPVTDKSFAYNLNLTTPGSLSGLTLLLDQIHRHGANASVELEHAGIHGYKATTDRDGEHEPTYGPVDGIRFDGRPYKALTVEQIKHIVKAYGEAAGLAKRAGADMVMIHGGHGWLPHQFMSPHFNTRTDEYGGSFENRMRFTLEVIESVRNAVGPGFPIEFRMSGSEKNEGGYDIDYGIQIAKAIDGKVDLIHVSCGNFTGFETEDFYNIHPSMFQEEGFNVHLAAEIKKHVKTPVATVGALTDPDYMEEIIASGKADVVEMARAILADPQFPNKVMAGRDDEIVRCLRCYRCFAERTHTVTRNCSVNPLLGREADGMEVYPSPNPKKVLVAGGGPGGMKAALTAKERGHEVILCEKSGELGGILKCEQAIDFKYPMYRLGLTLTRQLELAGVDVRLNTPVTPELVESIKPDALIVAVGSNPIVPPLPGIDGDNVLIINDYYLKKDKVGDSVVVMGGGQAGCECALHLAQDGKKVHLVEMRGELAPDANCKHRPKLLRLLDSNGVNIHLNCRGKAVSSDGLVCVDSDGKEILVPGETVVCAAGQRANRADVEALHRSAPWVREIGDCFKVATIRDAIYQGYHAGLDV